MHSKGEKSRFSPTVQGGNEKQHRQADKKAGLKIIKGFQTKTVKTAKKCYRSYLQLFVTAKLTM